MNDDTPPRKLTAEEAIRLKHHYNQRVLYGGTGLEARQVRELEDLTQNQRAEVARGFSVIRQTWWFFPDWVMVGGLLLGGVGYFFFQRSAVGIAAALVALYCAAHLCYRSGVLYGFERGYEDGNVSGVRKALGITPADAEDAHDRAIQMGLDEYLIAGFDEKGKNAE